MPEKLYANQLCNNKHILIIIVTYNRIHKLKHTLDFLFHELNVDGWECLVINNASSDGTREYLNEVDEGRLKKLHLKENVGGAGGFSVGMKYAVENGYKYCWVMDDDCCPQREALAALLQADADLEGNYGFLASVVVWRDGSICKMNRVLGPEGYYDNLLKFCGHKILPAYQTTFVSMFMRTAVISKLGLPIKEFFIWGDDLEYSRRIAIRNKKASYLVTGSYVMHDTETNVGSDISVDSRNRLFLYHYAYRNENYLFRQEGMRGLFYYIAKCVYHIVKILCRSPSLRLLRIRILLRGVMSGFFFQPQIEYPKQMKE